MNCKQCNQRHNNKTFCSHKCRNAWTTINNRTNNPVWDKDTLEKMRASLTGKKQSQETKDRRSKKLKQYYASNPEAKERLAKNVWDKYTSKIAGTGWAKISLRIRERDHFTCQICGANNNLMVHHKDWRGKRRGVPTSEWNNKDDNLITLCHKCHNGIHRHRSKDYRERAAIIAP